MLTWSLPANQAPKRKIENNKRKTKTEHKTPKAASSHRTPKQNKTKTKTTKAAAWADGSMRLVLVVAREALFFAPLKERLCGVVSNPRQQICTQNLQNLRPWSFESFEYTFCPWREDFRKVVFPAGGPKHVHKKHKNPQPGIFVFFVYVFWEFGSHFRKVVFEVEGTKCAQKTHRTPAQRFCGFCVPHFRSLSRI